jgi:RHS repeat-associated protein
MRVYRTQTDGSEPTVHAHYLYDSSGRRVKKLVRKHGGQIEVTVYIDGVFELQRIVRSGTVEQNNTLHVMDDQRRLALVRIGTPFATDSTPAVKNQLSDHLGNSNLVTDGNGDIINREEYTPYGESSFGSFARKRYRFSGQERDEESGLNQHGARSYAPWLIRWTSCDPAGPVAALDLYSYSHNPLSYTDPDGTEPASSEISIDTRQIIEDKTTIVIIGKQPAASQSPETNANSARAADELDTPGQMPRRSAGGEQTPTALPTQAIVKNEIPDASGELVQADTPSYAQTFEDFREGLLRGMAEAVPVVGWFIKPDASLRYDENAYEIGRGIGLITMGIVDVILGAGMVSAGGGAALFGLASGPGEVIIGPAGALVIIAGGAISINGALSVSAGAGILLSTGGSRKNRDGTPKSNIDRRDETDKKATGDAKKRRQWNRDVVDGEGKGTPDKDKLGKGKQGVLEELRELKDWVLGRN